MLSPKNQKVIQIEITNLCPHGCSNCTRFVGHHKKPFFMEFKDFKRAVDSLKGYKGMIGIMGGEPTLHPEFDRFVKYFNSVFSEKRIRKDFNPIPDFSKHRDNNLSSMGSKKGLWSSLGLGYYKHYELIQDSFGYQCINDHTNSGLHMALLLPRKELGIPDNEFYKLRDNCWLQREWSSSITPKGAFFCEVAASMDMLFNGAGGWKIEPGWWEREPKDFGYQLEWCELCSACLPVPGTQANSGVDIISPKMKKVLEKIGSKKVANGKVNIFDCSSYSAETYQVNKSCEPYLKGSDGVRVSGTNDTIKPKSLDMLMVSVGYDDYLDMTLPHNVKHADRVIVVTDDKDKYTPKVCKKHGAECIISNRIHSGGAVFAKGKAINDGLAYLKPKDWVLLMDADIILPENFEDKIFKNVLNPGCLYYTRRWGAAHIGLIPNFFKDFDRGLPKNELFRKYASREIAEVEGRRGNAIEYLPFGYFQLFNVKASSLQGRKYLYPENSQTAEYDDKEFGFNIFPEDKRVALPIWDYDVIHIPHGYFQENWEGRRSPRLEAVMRKPGEFESQVTNYICEKVCFYQGRKYIKGEPLTTDRWDVPKHFRRA